MTIFYFAFKIVNDQSMTVNRGLHPNIFDKAFKMHFTATKSPLSNFYDMVLKLSLVSVQHHTLGLFFG